MASVVVIVVVDSTATSSFFFEPFFAGTLLTADDAGIKFDSFDGVPVVVDESFSTTSLVEVSLVLIGASVLTS